MPGQRGYLEGFIAVGAFLDDHVRGESRRRSGTGDGGNSMNLLVEERGEGVGTAGTAGTYDGDVAGMYVG